MVEQLMLVNEAPLQITIGADGCTLVGDLRLPDAATGLILFAQGDSGDSRLSPHCHGLAQRLAEAGFASLLFDLLADDAEARRPNLDLLSRRLLAATDQLSSWPETSGLPIGYFGADTGAAAALLAAAERPGIVRAIVARRGRPDLAAARLSAVRAPTLLIVGGEDHRLITQNQSALAFLPDDSALALVPGAGPGLESPGALDQVASLAARWFARFLR